MDIWEILGISITTNISLIKKAFASKSKIYHPEDHPDEFKRLRVAYKEAIRYAKSNASNDFISSDQMKNTSSNSNDKYISFDFSNTKEEKHEILQDDLKSKPIIEEGEVTPRKSLFERMHGKSAQSSYDNKQTEVKKKSLYERMHGEKISNVYGGKTTDVYDVNQSEDSSNKYSKKEEFEFDFEQIVDTDTVERLVEELMIIFNNPFLRNNIVFWDIYFDHNWNGALLNNTYAANKIVEAMCKYQGWFEVTLNKLESKMRISLEKVRQNKMKIQSMASQYEMSYNSFILRKIMEYGFSNNLDNEDSINCYLSIYFELVRNKKIVFQDK